MRYIFIYLNSTIVMVIFQFGRITQIRFTYPSLKWRKTFHQENWDHIVCVLLMFKLLFFQSVSRYSGVLETTPASRQFYGPSDEMKNWKRLIKLSAERWEKLLKY